MKRILILSIILITLFTLKSNAQQSKRLNNNWEFLKSDLGGIWEAVRPAKEGSPESVPKWIKVNLPHCFYAEDAVDPDVNYYQGPGWYKSNVKVENPYQNGRTILHFEGAGQKTSVYIYTTKIAEHVGGYDEFTVDITDAVAAFKKDSAFAGRFNGQIPIAIRCDNSRDLEMIPSDLSDFNVYGGIYR
jgi:beta-galactosidase